MKPYLSNLLFCMCLACLAVVAGCSGGEADSAASGAASPAQKAPDMEADLARTVKQQSDFYVFKTAADFKADTEGLKWEDGSDLPEFADPDAKKGGTMRIRIQDFPRTLRTVGPDATGGIRAFLLDYTAVPFVQPHPNLPGRDVPGLASEWAVSKKDKTVYFKIDPEARWSDGKPITTDDVVFTFYYMRSPHLGDPWYNDFYTKTYSRLTVYDKRSFAITLFEAKPDMLDRAGNWVPYPRHAFADFGPGWTSKYDWRVLPMDGAYKLEKKDIDMGRSVTFTRIKNWWGQDKRFWRGRFNPDKLRLVVIRDTNKAFEAFRRGDLDMFPLGTPTLWYDKLPSSDDLIKDGYIDKTTFYNRIPPPSWGLWINESKPLLDNRDIRLGIQYATDFELVCKQYFRGDAVVQRTRNDGYGIAIDKSIHPRPFDPAKAREYFAKAGFTKQGPEGVLMNDKGQRLSFRITAYRFEGAAEILSILKQEALKAGIEYNLDIGDVTTAYKKVQQKNHQIALVALSRSVELYPRYWETYAGTNAYVDAYLDKDGKPVDNPEDGTPNPAPKKIRVDTNNMTETFIPELDRLIGKYRKSEDLDEIRSLASQMEQIIYHDADWVNGWKRPFFRVGYWRWVKWPKGFNAMQARDAYEFFLFSIDTDAKKKTLDARRSGKTFPPQVSTFDQYKEK